MIKHPDGAEADGTPRFRFELTREEMDAGLNTAFLTGPISGTIALGDVSYDVTENAIAIKAEHIELLQSAIHKAHHAAGRFLDSPVS